MMKLCLCLVMGAITACAATILVTNGQPATGNPMLAMTARVGESGRIAVVAPRGQLAVGQLLRAPIPAGALRPRYQWLRCNTDGLGCSGIRNANQQLYRIRPTDVNHRLRARIAWRGSRSATTAATGLVHSGGASSLQPVGDPLGKTWSAAFDDEFNGTRIDRSRWAELSGWRLDPNTNTTPSDCSERGGNAVLAVPGNGTGCALASVPAVTTGGTSTAGSNGSTLNVGDYYEARVYDPGQGTTRTSTIYNWPIVWAVGVPPPGGSGEPAGEIDVAEGLDHLEVNYHWQDRTGFHSKYVATPSGNWGNSWHVYGVYRGATQDQIFYDGVRVASVATSDNGRAEMLMVSSGQNSCCGAPSHTGPSANVLVDWVREWN